MPLYLFATFISFIIHAVLIVPFINFLYRIKAQRADQKTKDAFNKSTPIFDKFNKHKAGTPVGGGLLIITVTLSLFLFVLFLFVSFNQPIRTNFPSIAGEILILLFTFMSFGLLGVYDDLTKMFFWRKKGHFGLRLRHKLILETVLGLVIGYWLYASLKIDIIHVPFLGVYHIGVFYILFAAFTIISFANAVNMTDGLDGLATGVLMIALTSFWIIAASIIDVPTSIFIAIWLGGLMAFLYFNIPPARIFLGDTGSLSFGASFAVVGLILGKAFTLPLIGGIFLVEISSSFIQLMSRRFRHKKAFAAAPYHLFLQQRGWEEPKIVMRFWLISILLSVFGLMLAFMK
ncbi:phospho-N-acetylmuramoyl-pentapeptide-transferase [Candidatus Microgenomates bacterium]|nr:phospho-N-acetylmuramoyl-pentapeptide-transferase [Candidatus Microgenomates bacterium]